MERTLFPGFAGLLHPPQKRLIQKFKCACHIGLKLKSTSVRQINLHQRHIAGTLIEFLPHNFLILVGGAFFAEGGQYKTIRIIENTDDVEPKTTSEQMVSLKMICEYLDKELYTSYDLLGNVQTVSKNAVSKEDFINKLCKEIELC